MEYLQRQLKLCDLSGMTILVSFPIQTTLINTFTNYAIDNMFSTIN